MHTTTQPLPKKRLTLLIVICFSSIISPSFSDNDTNSSMPTPGKTSPVSVAVTSLLTQQLELVNLKPHNNAQAKNKFHALIEEKQALLALDFLLENPYAEINNQDIRILYNLCKQDRTGYLMQDFERLFKRT